MGTGACELEHEDEDVFLSEDCMIQIIKYFILIWMHLQQE